MKPTYPPQLLWPVEREAIRHLREQHEMTQEGLAHAAGSTAATISSIERGISNPSWGTVEAIAEALGVTMVEVARHASD
jgi:transcriptional regulator with XRE-family HTH domain